MHFSTTVTLAIGLTLFFTSTTQLSQASLARPQQNVASESLIHPRSLLERDQADGLDDGDDDDDDGDDGEETDEERFDYRAGVAEQLSSALEQVQPVVEKIQELINQADDENADEYGDQLSVHLNQIVDVGNSVADQMSSDQEFDAEDDTRLSRRCNRPDRSCGRRRRRKHKHCRKCRKHRARECGNLLFQWIKVAQTVLGAILATKFGKIKDKCRPCVPKITRSCARVVQTCGGYGIRLALRSMPAIDLSSFSNLGEGASNVVKAIYA